MRKPTKLLQVEAWPEADRRIWAAAFRKPDILEDGGPGAAWAEGSRRSVRYSYRRWLGFLTATDPDALLLDPIARVTADRLKHYIAELRATISLAGTHNYVKHLYDTMRVMAPGRDWGWLEHLAWSLGRLVTPRSKRDRVVPAYELLALGMELIERAESATENPALLYRDGLVIALLASRPIRRRNLAMMRIDKHLQRDGIGYRLVFTADETKTHTPLQWALPQGLTLFIDAYLERWRPRIHGADRHDGLWASAKGCPMSGEALYERVCLHTARAFGHAINLHLFRDCVATTIAVDDPVHVGIAAELLGHASLAITERYYIQAGTMEATRRHQQTMLAARDRFLAGDQSSE
jgi:integrase